MLNEHNTVFARSAQAGYFLHSTMPSVAWLRLSDVSLICRITYFSFQLSLLFFRISVARQHQHCAVLVLIHNIGHWTLPKIWVGTFLVRNVHPSGKTELILTVKMETRQFLKGSSGSEFPAICNHCGGRMAAWNRKTWKFYKQFWRVFGKTTSYSKIF